MDLLLDIFGYLGVVFRGTAVGLQAAGIGGIVFLAAIARPAAARPGLAELSARTYRGIALAALALAFVVAFNLALHVAALAGTIALKAGDVLGADSVMAGSVRVLAALGGAWAARRRRGITGLAGAAAILILAMLATSHAMARLDSRPILLLATLLHVIGASIWIGGIPFFLMALGMARNGANLALIGRRFSLISMTGVAMLLAGAAILFAYYIADPTALYGTAYGLMVTGKSALFASLLLLGAANYRLVERLRRDPSTPIARLRRFAEVEIGIGLAAFLTAVSITSLPPAVDLATERVTWAELAERLTPTVPRLTSPDHGDLAIPALQARLDREAEATRGRAGPAFIPGAGEMPPRNAFDVAWSEYNHHWAGIFVLVIGVLCLIEKSGRAAWTRHWPLLFLVLAGFLFWRSDPEAWPIGHIGFLDSLRDPEVVQHRLAVLVVIAFGLFEWGVRTQRVLAPAAALVLPVAMAIGGTLLLTHSHAIANVKEQLLIEITHLPMALLGIAAGAARWLELRLPGATGRAAGWVWPVCFLIIGVILLAYREA